MKGISIPEKTSVPEIVKAPVAAPKFEEPKPEKIDFFGQNDAMDDELADLEKEFDKNEQAKKSNPLGNSITKEMLQASKKEIDNEGFDIEEDFFAEQKPAAPAKKNLEIAIDDNADYEMENNQANQNLNNKLMNQGSPSPPGMGGEEEEEIEMT